MFFDDKKKRDNSTSNQEETSGFFDRQHEKMMELFHDMHTKRNATNVLTQSMTDEYDATEEEPTPRITVSDSITSLSDAPLGIVTNSTDIAHNTIIAGAGISLDNLNSGKILAYSDGYWQSIPQHYQYDTTRVDMQIDTYFDASRDVMVIIQLKDNQEVTSSHTVRHGIETHVSTFGHIVEKRLNHDDKDITDEARDLGVDIYRLNNDDLAILALTYGQAFAKFLNNK